MGWLEKIKNRLTKKMKYASMMNGYSPIFSQFGQDIFVSDVIQQAISCIVSEVSKLEPAHIKKSGYDYTEGKRSDLWKIMQYPNPIMTMSEFLEKMAWLLFLNDNAFAVPVYKVWKGENGEERRSYEAIYPIQPAQVDFIEDAAGELFIKFRFNNGLETIFPYCDVIHVRNKYSVNEYMGGGEDGQPNNAALLETLQLNKDLLTGVSAAVKSSFAINGVVKYGTIMTMEETIEALKEFEKALQESRSGILPLDMKGEYIKINRDIKLVDADTLKFIDEKILRHYGVSLPILTGDYTKAQFEAFYQKTIEPLVKKFSEAFTKALLTDRERSFGNKIMFFTHELIFMSVDQKLELIKEFGNSGTIFENEKRIALGLKPSAELEGVRMQSLNYINVEIATKYQLRGKKEVTKDEEEGA